MNYELHHIVKAFHAASLTRKLDVIAAINEKFLAMTLGVFMETRKLNSDGVTFHKRLRFIDSFKFMPCSLEKLVATLTDKQFTFLDSFCHGYTEMQRALLQRKTSFSYSYVVSFTQINDLMLPSLKNW